jgi:hypothetical protein
MNQTNYLPMALTFDQRSWIKVMTPPWVQSNNSVKFMSL